MKKLILRCWLLIALSPVILIGLLIQREKWVEADIQERWCQVNFGDGWEMLSPASNDQSGMCIHERGGVRWSPRMPVGSHRQRSW